MKKYTKIILSLAIIYSFGLACSQPEPECITPSELGIKAINPNGESELALLMRAMFEETKQIRQQINQGETIKTQLCQEQMLTAEATEPEKAASDLYKAYASAYLQTVEHLKSADPEHQLELYNSLVDNCMTCHKAMCPGPVAKIKKLL